MNDDDEIRELQDTVYGKYSFIMLTLAKLSRICKTLIVCVNFVTPLDVTS